MSIISERLTRLDAAAVQVFENLSITPLIGDGLAEPPYRLLDDALASGCARITEVSESGSVPELRFENGCEDPVLLLDGEELVGAKQNRILNLTVLVPAKTDLVIPVSCVEQGRWRESSKTFSSANRAHFSRGRASKLKSVSASMREAGIRRSDQGEVWGDIEMMSLRLDAPSATSAAAAMYDTHRTSLDRYLEGFSAIPKQVGAAFSINGSVAGFEVFDSPTTLAKMLPKLIESYALDAIDRATEAEPTPTGDAPASLLSAVADGESQVFPAIGLGEDWRIAGNATSAAALVHDDRVVHLCAFADALPAEASTRGSRLVRLSRRRRWH